MTGRMASRGRQILHFDPRTHTKKMFWFTVIVISLFPLTSFVTCESSPTPDDTSEARKLFAFSDTNFDHQLTYDEFDEAFMSCDINGDGKVRPEELLSKFLKEKLGGVKDALVLFYNLDVNADRSITAEPDLRAAEKFFDTNEDKLISDMEFENQFVKLAGNYDDSMVANSTLIVDSLE